MEPLVEYQPSILREGRVQIGGEDTIEGVGPETGGEAEGDSLENAIEAERGVIMAMAMTIQLRWRQRKVAVEE